MAKPIDIRVLPLTGQAFHSSDDHPHSHGHDFIVAGEATLGALSYSLLRAEAMILRHHRARAMQAVWERFHEFADIYESVGAIDPGSARKMARQRPRMLVWDLIGLIGEACEQLAAIHAAVHAWRDSQAEISTSLLSWRTPTDTAFTTAVFRDDAWWRRELGVEPDPDRLTELTSRQRRIVRAVLGQVAARLPRALDALATQYTPELHRIAVRRKHLIPLLDATLGLVFATEDSESGRWLAEQVEEGALIVADDKIVRGRLSQIVVPVTDETIDRLFDLWAHANWLSGSLAGATISRAENPASVSWAWDYDAAMPGDVDAVLGAVAAYTGLPAEQLREERVIAASGAEVMRLARARLAEHANSRTLPDGNRATRRHAATPRRPDGR